MRDIGASIGEIAEAGRLPGDAIEKHFAECLPPITGGQESDAQLAQLLRDATELYYASVLASAWASASSSLAVRLRALTELARRAELRVKQGDLFDGSDPLRPETFGPEISAFIAAYTDGLLQRCMAAFDEVSA